MIPSDQMSLLFEVIDQMSLLFEVVKYQVHPQKLTWNLKIIKLKRKIIFQTSIFGFKVLIFRGVFEVVTRMCKKKGEPCNSSKVFLKFPTCKAWRFQLPFSWSCFWMLGVREQWSSWDFSWLSYNQQEKINWKYMLQIEGMKHINTVRRRHCSYCGKMKRINNPCLFLFRLSEQVTVEKHVALMKYTV